MPLDSPFRKRRGNDSPFGNGSLFDAYKASGLAPDFVADFENSKYAMPGAYGFSNLLTHTRSGNATVTDSDGPVKWGAHNLLTYSEQFDNAAWFKGNTTVTANQAVAPDGTTTADQVDFAAVANANIQRAVATSVVSGADYTFAFWAWADSAVDNVKINMQGSDQAISITTTPTLFTREVTASGATLTTTLVTRDSQAATIYLWGAHLYRSDLGGMQNNPDTGDSYVPTTSAAVYMRREDYASGAKRVLVEEAATNLITYARDFDQWASTNSTSVVGQTSIDGTTGASLYTVTSAVANRVRFTTTQSASTDHAYSIVAKAGTGNYIFIRNLAIDGSSAVDGVWFDASDFSVSTLGSGVTEAGAESLGDGFYRLWMRGTTEATIGANFVDFGVSDVTGATTATIGVTATFDFAQLEQTSGMPTSLIPTNGSTVTRAADSLYIPATNLPDYQTPTYLSDTLVTNGTFDTDSDWTKGTGWTIGSGVASFTPGSGNLTQSISITSGDVYEVTFTLSNTQAGTFLGVRLGGTTNQVTYSGVSDGVKTAVLVAEGADTLLKFAPGVGGSVSIDNISVRQIKPLSVCFALEGEMTYADTDVGVAVDGQTGEVMFVSWRVDNSNYIAAGLSTGGAATGQPVFVQEVSGGFDFVNPAGSPYSPGINVPFSIASRHGSTFINGAVDGVALTEDTTPTALFNGSAADLYLAYSGGPMRLKRFLMWVTPDDIGDAGIAEVSA